MNNNGFDRPFKLTFLYAPLKVAPKIKEQMAHSGTLMIGYSPLKAKNLGNFFRMVFTCFPILKSKELDFILDEIERLGEKIVL